MTDPAAHTAHIPDIRALADGLLVDDIDADELAAGETRESLESQGFNVHRHVIIRDEETSRMRVHDEHDAAGWQAHPWTIMDSRYDLGMDYEDAREYATDLLRGAFVAEVLNDGRSDETLHSLHDDDPDADPTTLLTDWRHGVNIESDSGGPWSGCVERIDFATGEQMRETALELFRQSFLVDLLNERSAS